MHNALISLHEHQCLTSTWVVLLHIGDFTAPIAPHIFKTEYVYAIVTRPVYVTCDPAHLLKTAIGGTGENRITYLRGATDLCEIFSNNSLVLSFHLSDYVVATKFTKIYFTNSLANKGSCVMVCASLKV